MKRILGFAALSASLVLTLRLTACTAGSALYAVDAGPEGCAQGAEGCTCTGGGGCDPGLQCLSKTCVRLGGYEGGIVVDGGSTDTGSPVDGVTGGDSTASDGAIGDDSAQDDVASPPDCGRLASFHDAAPGAYCPFQEAGTAPCAAGETCCEPKFPQDLAPATCISGQSDPNACTFAVDGGIGVECEVDQQCPNGTVCCITVTLKQDPGCTNYYGFGFNGTTCKTACSAGDLPACQFGGCATGTCTPFRARGLELAVCL
jgi:hypothetical protein